MPVFYQNLTMQTSSTTLPLQMKKCMCHLSTRRLEVQTSVTLVYTRKMHSNHVSQAIYFVPDGGNDELSDVLCVKTTQKMIALARSS